VEDVKPDSAFVVTCTGYTRHAQTFAKAKDIKLAVLRAFEESDWEGRIKTIIVNMRVNTPPRINRFDLNVESEGGRRYLVRDIEEVIGSLALLSNASPLYLVSKTEKLQLADYVDRKIGGLGEVSETKDVDLPVDPAEWQIQIGDRGLHQFNTLVIKITVFAIFNHEINVTSNRLAELILKGFAGNDIIIFADQLAGVKFEPLTQ
jgi:hypothetical protein